MAAKQSSLPLYEKIIHKNTLQRTIHLITFSILFTLLLYRLVSLKNHGLTWFLALLCESWFTFSAVLVMNTKWNPVEYKTYPERLLECERELPPVDVFVTTADPMLESPILTVNTVLSLLAVDYPPHKLACYVSDDGCSPLTFYSLVEAAKFAQSWVPFCNKYNLHLRAPFRYFSGEQTCRDDTDGTPEFQQEWTKMKFEYEQLSKKIDDAAKRPIPCDLSGKFEVFSNIQLRNHPSIVKVLWEDKKGLSGGLPRLIYISREKRPNQPHHYKAGAMNALIRVSGVMTNAPFMLNVDCDMYANDPQVILHAMCLLLGTHRKRESAFVQFPQAYYDGLKDPSIVFNEFIGRGMSGLQGYIYAGTGCFHRRNVIYGLRPDEIENDISVNERLANEKLQKKFGNSVEFTKSVAQVWSGWNVKSHHPNDLSSSVEAAHQVAGSGYEYGTVWGTEVGLFYGSTTEDMLTGMMIHARGWSSMLCTPDPPAFLGCVPPNVPVALIQQKRWATGFLEILLSRNSPVVVTITGKLRFRQFLVYLWILSWPLRCIPEQCYALLPAYCIITNSHFLPKGPALLIPVAAFVIYCLSNLAEYLAIGSSIQVWWMTEKMARTVSATAWVLAVFSFILKCLGLSETVFEVTQKGQTSSAPEDNADAGGFTFNESPIFVPGIAILLVHLIALAVASLGLQPPGHGGHGTGLGEVVCSVVWVICFRTFAGGLFGKGKYGIPTSTICKSTALALLFALFCRWVSIKVINDSSWA